MASSLNLAFMCLFIVASLSARCTASEFRDLVEEKAEENSDLIPGEGGAVKREEYQDADVDVEEERPAQSGLQKFLSNPFGGLFGAKKSEKPKPKEEEEDGGFWNPKPVTATKSVTITVTKRVTKHPVCMTVVGAQKPKCLDSESDVVYYPKSNGASEEDVVDEAESIIESVHIEPTASVKIPSASVSVDSPATLTRSRSGRYLSFENTPTIEHVNSGINEAADEGRFLFKAPSTKLVTKLVRVTKTQRVVNPAVTATLLVDNCIPVGTNIPLCNPNKGVLDEYAHSTIAH